jgi:hypothetical protein
MLINAKIINTRVKSWIDKKTGKTIKFLIVSVKTIDCKKYAVSSYGDSNVGLLNIKNIEILKNESKQLVYKAKPSNELVSNKLPKK